MIPMFKRKADDPLMLEIERARLEWDRAVRQLDFAETAYIDHAVFRINCALAQYTALLKEARKNGLTAWDLPLRPPAGVTGPPGE